jgi:hypothetical protein
MNMKNAPIDFKIFLGAKFHHISRRKKVEFVTNINKYYVIRK